jgi:hypothetical protein
MKEMLWLGLRRLYTRSAHANMMMTLSFRLVWVSLVVPKQQAAVASNRYAKLIDKVR